MSFMCDGFWSDEKSTDFIFTYTALVSIPTYILVSDNKIPYGTYTDSFIISTKIQSFK
jgi:hypothetical protein